MSCEFANLGGDEVAAALEVLQKQGFAQLQDKKGRVLRQERYAGACSRSFYVGDVRPEDVKAKYEFGVLNIVVPMQEPRYLEPAGKVAIE